MSINVTVTGNPISICHGRTVLSDLDQIKKNERDRRRKLRLEQVRQQSKEISSRLLERAKNVTKSHLSQLEKHERSELKRMHDQRLSDLQRKYQADMEDIGQAHESALVQPNVDLILEADSERNRLNAIERGREASQRLEESNQIKETQLARHDRQKQVREMENIRAAMIASLPNKPNLQNNSEIDSNSSHEESATRNSPEKRKSRKTKGPRKSTRRIFVRSPDLRVDISDRKPRAPRSDHSKGVKSRQERVSDQRTTSNKPSIPDSPRVSTVYEFEGDEPRDCMPASYPLSRAEKVARYNPQDYKPNSLSSVSTSSSRSTLSDDSSYFSDGAVDQFKSEQTPRYATSIASSNVQLYDHNTRQRNIYHKPIAVVEKTDISGVPNAEELARLMVESETADVRLAHKRRLHAQRRGHDALLRNRVRRDYERLQQNLDHLHREERKLTASRLRSPLAKEIHLTPDRRRELLSNRQQHMEDVLARNLNFHLTQATHANHGSLKRIVTISSNDGMDDANTSPHAVWQEPAFVESPGSIADEHDDKQNELSRNEHILEMLHKVEKQKRLLLREFGADLPDNVFSASMKPLFAEEAPVEQVSPKVQQQTSAISEVETSDLPSCAENNGRKTIQESEQRSPLPQRIEIAVQTSMLDEIGAAADKSVQVELTNSQHSGSTQSSEEIGENIPSNSNLVTETITGTDTNSGSSDDVETGVIIDFAKNHIKVTPRKLRTPAKRTKRNSQRATAKPRSTPNLVTGLPTKKFYRSATISKQMTPKGKNVSTRPVRTAEKKVKIHVDNGDIKVQINPRPEKDITKADSTASSAADSLGAMRKKPILFKKSTHSKPVSDTSTSYASLPPTLPASNPNTFTDSIPVLEILDNSENESVKLRKKGISPVSSPGTPSPRVVNLPTNTPYSRYVKKILEFTDPSISQSLQNGMSILLPQRQSTPNEPATSGPSQKSIATNGSSRSSYNCACQNPQCKLLNTHVNGIQQYATNSYPEVLKKYQDLKITCTERIASLTDLIEQVRSDQRCMELSIDGQNNESTTFHIPLPRSTRTNMHTVCKLVDSIEAIHNQLAKTLVESQRIIATDERGEKPSNVKNTLNRIRSPVARENLLPSNSESTRKSATNDSKRQTPKKTLPKVIRTEIVRIPLSLLKQMPNAGSSTNSNTVEGGKAIPSKYIQRDEDLVEQLSKEILEQSKTLDNPLTSETSHNSSEFTGKSSLFMNPMSVSSPHSPRDQFPSNTSEQRVQSVPPASRSDSEYQNEPSTIGSKPEGSQLKKDTEFIPLLAGIPKVHKTPAPGSDRCRPRPPITLIYGPHRIPTVSPGHELSTIVEFDTPDTANRSHGSGKSGRGKSSKNLSQKYRDTGGNLAGCLPNTTQTSSPTRYKSPVTPTRKCTPSPAYDTKQTSTQQASVSRTSEHEDECENSCPRSRIRSLQTSLDGSNSRTDKGVSRKNDSNDTSGSLPDISFELKKRNLVFNVQIDCTKQNERLNFDACHQASPKTLDEPNKDKITPTTSNSFSGLSGISEIMSTPSSDLLKQTSSPEEMEVALKKLGLGWALATLKKTREASALSSSSNSDAIPMTPARKTVSPTKKDIDSQFHYLPELSDVSTISMKHVNKSTERALLLKARTSTPNIENSNSSHEKSASSMLHASEPSPQIGNGIIFTTPNFCLLDRKNISSNRQREVMSHSAGPNEES